MGYPDIEKSSIGVLCGPTCVGKTALAIKLAKKLGGDVISADSRQVYKYMDIGTGKTGGVPDTELVKHADRWCISGVNVWGYDLATPDKPFSGFDFALYALDKVRELMQRGRRVFVVGGTGFYIDLLTGKIQLTAGAANPELRESLNAMSLEALSTMLTSLNLNNGEVPDMQNKVRVIRAIERATAPKQIPTPLPYLPKNAYKYIGLTAPRSVLYSRADAWLEAIWSRGLLAEVQVLQSLGYGNSPKMQGLVYRSAVSYLAGEVSEDAAVQQAKYDLHAYIRRQQTWFKKNSSIVWCDITEANYEQNVYNLING